MKRHQIKRIKKSYGKRHSKLFTQAEIVMNKRMLDIVEIKVAKYLKFFIEDKYIYCENIVTGERVIVGEIDAED